jgi:SAM-dependent methyltransferase
MAERRESIVDASVPNAGRIYDYVLGGHHNFEVDRQAAEQMRQLIPFGYKMARLQRWCLQDLAVELTKNRGFDVIVDFASGLPTNDHIHHVAPEGTTVIYSDYDPVVVEYAHEILGDTPNVYFFEVDARRPEELLNHPEVQDILGGRRDVAVVYWGISGFLTDEELTRTARILHDWTEERSCWVFNAQMAGANVNDPGMAKALKIYEQMGSPAYIRSLEEYEELIQPWRPEKAGFVSLLEWHGFDQTEMTEEARRIYGPSGGGYGAYLAK